MKKKVVTLCLVLALAAIAIAGGTIAYFSDTDAQTNTFTVGNVEIDLFEDFDKDMVLLPAVGTIDENGYAVYENKVEKEVYVENTGEQASYVRVHIAIPSINNQTPDAEGNAIGWQFPIRLCWSEYTCHVDQWNWGKVKEANDKYEGLINSGFDANTYSTYINGIRYFVYVGTFETALNKGDVTPDAIDNVYMIPEITQDDIAYFDANAAGWNNVYVVAEAVQAQGFADAFAALNEAFGTPGSEGYVAPDFLAASNGKTIVERTGAEGK